MIYRDKLFFFLVIGMVVLFYYIFWVEVMDDLMIIFMKVKFF